MQHGHALKKVKFDLLTPRVEWEGSACKIFDTMLLNLYINGLLQHETFCQSASIDILQQALYQRFEPSLHSYIEAFL